MHLLNNRARYFAQAFVVVSAESVVSGCQTAKAKVATKVNDHKATKDAKAFAAEHNAAQGIK
jgi:hypothetical protein